MYISSTYLDMFYLPPSYLTSVNNETEICYYLIVCCCSCLCGPRSSLQHLPPGTFGDWLPLLLFVVIVAVVTAVIVVVAAVPARPND